jgi:hypothetical protein
MSVIAACSQRLSFGYAETAPVMLFVVATLLAGCNCANETPAEHLSPDGQWKHVSFDRNCGATTGSNLQVSVPPASKSLPNSVANASVADDNHGATRFVAQSDWISPTKLRITYSPKARIFKRESKVGKIDIEYVTER